MENAYKLLMNTLDDLQLLDESKHTLLINYNGGLDYFTDQQNLTTYQPFKPLAKGDPEPLENIPSSSVDLALITGTKHVKETQYYIAMAWESLRPDGSLLISADNKENGKRLEKWLRELTEEVQSFSGHKSRCALIQKTSQASNSVTDQWKEDGKIQKNPQGFFSQPGLFSWDRIDRASELLIQIMDEPVHGRVADFGCGYGYLSAIIQEKNPDISSLSGYDADMRAINCYEQNLSDFSKTLSTHWYDLSNYTDAQPNYDFILMNPPFHEGRKESIFLGETFIKNAASALKNKGTLWIVANRHLPYERTLESCFKNIEKKGEQNGFKVYKAIK